MPASLFSCFMAVLFFFFSLFADTGEAFGLGARREPVGLFQHRVPVQICLPSGKHWAFGTKVLGQIMTLLGRQDTSTLSC